VSCAGPAPWRSAASSRRYVALPRFARAGHEDRARAVARADEDVGGPGRAVHEVPRAQAALLAFEDRDALA
jgi:hypothetical protein